MNHKILIATQSKKDGEFLEQTLHDFVEKGGELLFTKRKDEILDLLKKETPALSFIDEAFELTNVDQYQIIWIKKDKPLTKDKVIEICAQTFPIWEEAKPSPM